MSSLRTRIREGSTTTIEETNLCSEIVANILVNESQIAFAFQCDPRKRIRPLPLSDRLAISRGKSRSAVIRMAPSCPAAFRISLSDRRCHPLSKIWKASGPIDLRNSATVGGMGASMRNFTCRTRQPHLLPAMPHNATLPRCLPAPGMGTGG